MKVTIIKDDCTGCGLCEETCPEVFGMGDDDIAIVKADPVPAEHEAKAKEAADDCASEAIKVE